MSASKRPVHLAAASLLGGGGTGLGDARYDSAGSAAAGAALAFLPRVRLA